MKGLKYWSAALVASAVLTACGGGGGGSETNVAGADVTAAASPTVASALVGTAFSFPGGATELGTGGTDTTVSWTAGGDSPAFSIASGGMTATGTTTFGSCIFAVATSSFPAGHRLAAGQVVTINPCNIRLGTQGAPADSVARQRAAVFILGTAASTGSTVTITINPGGAVTVNGQAAGTVTLVPVTG